MKTRALVFLFAGVAVLASACDSGPQSGPGTLTATLLSPNGAEGAAMVEVFGPGIGGVQPLGGRVFSERRGDTLRVVVVRADEAGDLAFTLAVADTTQVFGATVLEVAGPDDALRTALSSYELEIRR